MTKTTENVELIDIPSQPVLQKRLAETLVEARRLRLLIRTAKQLEEIDLEQNTPPSSKEVEHA